MTVEEMKTEALLVAESTIERLYSEKLMKERLCEMQKEYILYQARKIEQLELQLAHYKEFYGGKG